MDAETRRVNIPFLLAQRERAGHHLLMSTPHDIEEIWNRGRAAGFRLRNLYVLREALVEGLQGQHADDTGDVWILYQPDDLDGTYRVLLHEMAHAVSRNITPRTSTTGLAKAEAQTWQNAHHFAKEWGLGHLFTDDLIHGYMQEIEGESRLYELSGYMAGSRRGVVARAAWDALYTIREFHNWPMEDFIRMMQPGVDHADDQAMIELVGFDRRSLRLYSILTPATWHAVRNQAELRAQLIHDMYPSRTRQPPMSFVTELDFMISARDAQPYDFENRYAPTTGASARLLHNALTWSAMNPNQWKRRVISQPKLRPRTTNHSLDISIQDGATFSMAIRALNSAMLDHPSLYINPTWVISDGAGGAPIYTLRIEYVDRRFVIWHTMEVRVTVDLPRKARGRTEASLQLYMKGWPGGNLVHAPAPD